MTEQSIGTITKDFISRVRQHISATSEAETDATVERVISGAAALLAGVTLLIAGKHKEPLALALASAAVRHYLVTKPKVVEG